MCYEKRPEDLEKVLKFIDDNFDALFIRELPDEEGILHGHEIADTNSGEIVTVGYDHIFNQVMYLRTCQPLMYDAIFKDNPFNKK